MNLNAGAVLLIFHHQDEQLMAIMKRCLIFSIFQKNNFGNEREKHYFCK